MEQEILQQEETTEKTFQEYPMVALRGLVVFPHMNLNFDVSRKMSGSRGSYDRGTDAVFDQAEVCFYRRAEV